jgi:hypothetical protein
MIPSSPATVQAATTLMAMDAEQGGPVRMVAPVLRPHAPFSHAIAAASVALPPPTPESVAALQSALTDYLQGMDGGNLLLLTDSLKAVNRLQAGLQRHFRGRPDRESREKLTRLVRTLLSWKLPARQPPPSSSSSSDEE